MVPLDLRLRGPLEAKSFIRALKIDPPGAPGRAFDLKCRFRGRDRRCIKTSSGFGMRDLQGHQERMMMRRQEEEDEEVGEQLEA